MLYKVWLILENHFCYNQTFRFMKIFPNKISAIGFFMVIFTSISFIESEIVNAAIAVLGLLLYFIGLYRQKKNIKIG